MNNVDPDAPPASEMEKYAEIAHAFIKKTKGWTQDEYSLVYRATFRKIKVVAFNALRHDAREELKKMTGFAVHPTGEIQVYVQIDKLRAFSDKEEFHNLRYDEYMRAK